MSVTDVRMFASSAIRSTISRNSTRHQWCFRNGGYVKSTRSGMPTICVPQFDEEALEMLRDTHRPTMWERWLAVVARSSVSRS